MFNIDIVKNSDNWQFMNTSKSFYKTNDIPIKSGHNIKTGLAVV